MLDYNRICTLCICRDVGPFEILFYLGVPYYVDDLDYDDEGSVGGLSGSGTDEEETSGEKSSGQGRYDMQTVDMGKNVTSSMNKACAFRRAPYSLNKC